MERRDGDLLLAAAAGSGKTRVLTERYVRERRRGRAARRLAPRHHVHREGGGRAGRARARGPAGGRARAGGGGGRARLDRHDPRLLRARAAHPRRGRRASTRASRVLDEVGGRPARGRGVRRRGRARRRRAPRRLRPRRLRDAILGAHAELRARGQRRDAARPGPARRPRRGASPRGSRRRRPRSARRTRPTGRRRPRSTRCADLLAAGFDPLPRPDVVGRTSRRTGERRRREATELPRRASAALRPAVADAHARPAWAALDDLLGRFATAYAEAQARALGARLRRPRAPRPRPARGAARRPGAARRAVRAHHGRRVPGHEPAADGDHRPRSAGTTSSPSATSSRRSTASATPTSATSAAAAPRSRPAARVSAR